MKMWATIIKAIDPKTEKLTEYFGPYVPGKTKEEAEKYCQENGLGYCEIFGEFVAEIPM